MATATGWKRVGRGEGAEFGVSYRTFYYIDETKLRWSKPLSEKLAKLIYGADRASELIGHVSIDRVVVYSPAATPQPAGRGTGKSRLWGIKVEWHKIGKGTPVVVIAGAIIAVVAVLVAGWVIVATVTEKQFSEVREDLRDFFGGVKELSPGLVIAAIVMAFLFLRGR